MARIWTVRLKKDLLPSYGIVKGLTIQVTTQQNSHDYPSLRQALIDAGYEIMKSQGGHWNDAYWDWD